jgi:cyclic lactone autoinducer peptide
LGVQGKSVDLHNKVFYTFPRTEGVNLMMKATKNSKAGVKKAITKVAIKTAINSKNSTCLWFQYQPTAPKALERFKNLK